jgi:hypothetical protein
MTRQSYLVPQRDDILRRIDELRVLAANLDPAAPKEYFIPRFTLAKELTREKIKTLLDYEEVRDVDYDTIHDNYLAVFGTLIRIQKISYIAHFVHYQEFADIRLPFTTDHGWPPACSVVFEPFERAQWEFCAQELCFGRLDKVTLHPDRIIPITRRNVLKASPDSRVEKVTIHLDYNRLFSAVCLVILRA